MPGQAGLAFPAMKKLLVLSLACALLAPAALSAADFEGTVSMKMSGREAAAKGGGAVMNFSLKGGLTRMDMDAQGMSVGVIMDPAKQQMTMLMVQQHMYMIRPMATPEAPAGTSAGKAPEMTLEKTSTTEKILGYECVKYVAKDDKGKSTELWLTDQLGSFMGFGSGGGPMGRRGGGGPMPQGWEQLLQGKSLFPMRVVSLDAGQEVGRMEVTAVEKKSMPDSLFTVPADWQDMSAMMRGMGAPGGMPPGMPPRGGN